MALSNGAIFMKFGRAPATINSLVTLLDTFVSSFGQERPDYQRRLRYLAADLGDVFDDVDDLLQRPL